MAEASRIGLETASFPIFPPITRWHVTCLSPLSVRSYGMLRLLPLTRFLHFRPPLLQARKLKKALAQNAAQANQMKAVAACASLQRCTRLTSGLTCPRPSTPPLTTTLKTSLAQPVFSSLQPQVRGIRAANAWKRDDQRLVLARKRAKAGRRGNQDTGHVQCRQRTKKARSSHQPPKRSVRRWRI